MLQTFQLFSRYTDLYVLQTLFRYNFVIFIAKKSSKHCDSLINVEMNRIRHYNLYFECLSTRTFLRYCL